MDMELSLGGLLGAIGGTIVAAVIYAQIAAFIGDHARARYRSASAEERTQLEERLSILRRTILGIDIALFAAGGYWLGQLVTG